MAIGTKHLAFIYLRLDFRDWISAGDHETNLFLLTPQVMEFKNHRIGLATLNAWVHRKILQNKLSGFLTSRDFPYQDILLMGILVLLIPLLLMLTLAVPASLVAYS